MNQIVRFDRIEEAMAGWAADAAMLEALGAVLPGVKAYTPESWKRNWTLALDQASAAFGFAFDAQPSLATTPNSAVPAMLTTMIDPEVFRIRFAPNKGAKILGEVRKGTWLDETAMFPTVEYQGEVSSYGDFAESGRAGVNTSWPQRQSYLFQVIKEYGERELERAGLARIGWVSEVDGAAALALSKFENVAYFYGVAGLQNYGLLNDPGLSASLTPAVKAAGGTKWTSGGAIVATANEIYADIQAIFLQLVKQSAGTIEKEDKLVLAMSPNSAVALTATNSFAVGVYDLLKKNFPNIRFETAVQYSALSSSNPQGFAGGEYVQMLAESIEGQKTGYCAFNEKMRGHPIVRGLSSFKQKMTSGVWGAVLRQPFAIAAMVGV